MPKAYLPSEAHKILVEYFNNRDYIGERMSELLEKTGLKEGQITSWFGRARQKRKTAEEQTQIKNSDAIADLQIQLEASRAENESLRALQKSRTGEEREQSSDTIADLRNQLEASRAENESLRAVVAALKRDLEVALAPVLMVDELLYGADGPDGDGGATSLNPVGIYLGGLLSGANDGGCHTIQLSGP